MMNIFNVIVLFYVYYLRKNIELDIKVNLEDDESEVFVWYMLYYVNLKFFKILEILCVYV